MAACTGRAALRPGPLERSCGCTRVGWLPGAYVDLGAGGPAYHVLGCSREIAWLTVRQRLEKDRPIVFHGGGPVSAGEVRIYEGGDLRCALQNAWYDGENSGLFSLLHGAGRLLVRDPQALRDLLDYVEGRYELGAGWEPMRLDGAMEVTVECPRGELSVVERLRAHFGGLELRRLRVALGAHNTVDAGCWRWAFTGCGGARPRDIVIDARMTSGIDIEFRDADGEVRVPHITIGPRGSLGAAVRNCWQGGGKDGYYSLLWHAEAITVRDNPRAVRDLLAYARGRYDTGYPCWPVRPLGGGVRVTVCGAGGYGERFAALAGRFAGATADGAGLLAEVRQLRRLRASAAAGRRLVASLAAAARRARRQLDAALGPVQ